MFTSTIIRKDGSDGQSNKIKKLYAYDENINTVQPSGNAQNQNTSGTWVAGEF